MKKTFFALCIALSIFICSSMYASASVCSGSSDGVHHFTGHQTVGSLGSKENGTHTYLYGYDHNGQPIYKDNCKLTLVYSYCVYKCEYCSVWESSEQHKHYLYTEHSINHKK